MDPLEDDIAALFNRFGRAVERKRWWHRFMRPTSEGQPNFQVSVQFRKIRTIGEIWMPQDTKVDLQPVQAVLRMEAQTIRNTLEDTLKQDPSAFDLQTKLLLKWQSTVRAIDILDGKCDINGQPTAAPLEDEALPKTHHADASIYRPRGKREMPVAAPLSSLSFEKLPDGGEAGVEQPDKGKTNLRNSP